MERMPSGRSDLTHGDVGAGAGGYRVSPVISLYSNGVPFGEAAMCHGGEGARRTGGLPARAWLLIGTGDLARGCEGWRCWMRRGDRDAKKLVRLLSLLRDPAAILEERPKKTARILLPGLDECFGLRLGIRRLETLLGGEGGGCFDDVATGEGTLLEELRCVRWRR